MKRGIGQLVEINQPMRASFLVTSLNMERTHQVYTCIFF